jgi:hypothetical protein
MENRHTGCVGPINAAKVSKQVVDTWRVGMTDPAVFCAHTELVDIEKLVPNPRNPNRHPENQIKLLAKIIRAQGWRSFQAS